MAGNEKLSAVRKFNRFELKYLISYDTAQKLQEDLKKSDGDLWERVISQIQSSTTRQVFKDHMTIDKVTDNEVSLIHDNNMIAKTMLEKEHKEIEALLEKELGKKVTLNVQGMSKEEYFQRLMGKM